MVLMNKYMMLIWFQKIGTRYYVHDKTKKKTNIYIYTLHLSAADQTLLPI